MQTLSRTPFTTVKTEGGILPADLLSRVAAGAVAGLRPEDYHLAPSERLNEAISRSWNRLLGVWRSFDDQRRALPEADSGVTLTRERWLLILFQELGYGRLSFVGKMTVLATGGLGQAPSGVQAKTGPSGGGRGSEADTYPISHIWQHAPIHLVSFRQELDRRDPAVGRSPHSLLQEFLNRWDASLWGFTSNGLRLRVLRDNASLTRAAYVEFDLEAMMAGELYSDFTLLWLVCHQSRVESLGSGEEGVGSGEWGVGSGAAATPPTPYSLPPTPHSLSPTPSSCWLERWSHTAAEQGARALDALRDGVQEAISALGMGFLQHRANGALRAALKAGDLPAADYYRELLRLVYRLIFLFVAEDRNLLLLPDATAQARERYRSYSLGRLRDLAQARRGSPHPDLYRGLRLLFTKLRTGYPPLGLPGLGGFLFSDRSTPHLDDADIANRDLLDALRALAFAVDNGVRRPVDYRNLDTEELGSVYESLLELHPQLNVDAATFALEVVAGSERKTTGTHYTPTPLVNSLLDTALEPVIADRLKGVGSGEWGVGGKGQRNYGSGERSSAVVSGSQGVAGWDEPGRGMLPADGSVSQSGDLRHDLADSAGVDIDPGQHRRGLRTGEPGGVHSLSEDRTRVAEGTGDLSAPFDAGGLHNPGSSPTTHQPMRSAGQNAPGAYPVSSELTTPHSPLPIPYSPQESAILSIKVLDYACGSGHMLIGAGRRLARHLARIRTGDEEPSPEAMRAAMRDVVRHCLYGVDINEMAVELCKVALWMESLEPGKPLTFLDKNIQCGNSLLGATPAALAQGIPDAAFTPLQGDDKAYCQEWKRRNKAQRAGQLSLFSHDLQPWERLGHLAAAMAQMDAAGDDTLAGVQRQEALYEQLVRSSDYRYGRLLADAWCAAFVWRKTQAYAYPITEEVFRRIERNPFDVAPWMVEEIGRLAAQYQFLHWHLAFPQVFRPAARGANPWGLDGGFDVVLSNPPWEHTELKEKEFFATRRLDIVHAPTGAERKRLIDDLAVEDPSLFQAFIDASREHDAVSAFVRTCEQFPLCGRGRINTYAVFAEMARLLLNPAGQAGVIVPSGIATDDTTKFFFQDLMETGTLASLFDFENRRAIFTAVHRSFKFCLLTLRGEGSREWGMGSGERAAESGEQSNRHSLLPTPYSPPPPAEFVFFALDVADLRDAERRFTLSAADIALLNPNTRTCPIFRSKRDAELTKSIYRRVPVLVREGPPEENPWGVFFRQGLFNMTSDSHLFRTRGQLEAEGWRLVGNRFVRPSSVMLSGSGRQHPPSQVASEASRPGEGDSSAAPQNDGVYLPLYEAKLFHHFDHRWATYEGQQTRDFNGDEKYRPDLVAQPRYWVSQADVMTRVGQWPHNWFLTYRDIARSTDERTTIMTVVSITGTGCHLCLPTVKTAADAAPLLANLDTFVEDFVIRQKIGGTHLNFFYVESIR